MKYINALTIAGTDPIGGSGIQADLKTFSSLRVYGCSVITALVAQNTYGVQSIYRIKPDFVISQLESVFNDVQIDSIKIGMLAESDIIEAVAEQLQRYKVKNIVLDTVMVAKSGDLLLSSDAVSLMRTKLLPYVSIITPNLVEAANLLETSVACDERDIKKQGFAFLRMGCKAVLIKGGHLNHHESPDWLFTETGEYRFSTPRIVTKNIHGTGCTLSAAMAALRPSYFNWTETVQKAKNWISNAIAKSDSLKVGSGNGPVHHFHEWW